MTAEWAANGTHSVEPPQQVKDDGVEDIVLLPNGWLNWILGELSNSSPRAPQFLHVNEADSGAVANTVTETTFTGATNTYTLPSNTIKKANAVLRLRISVSYTRTGTPNLTLRLRSDVAGVIYAVTIPTGANGSAEIEFDLIVQTIGSATGRQRGRTTSEESGVEDIVHGGSVVFDPTVANVLTVTGQWGAADPLNSVTLRSFDVAVAQGI